MKNNDQLTDSMFHIMSALAKPRHGYAVMNLIEEASHGLIKIGPASMYTIIKKLLQNEWIFLYDDSDSRRKIYTLTDLGRSILLKDVELRKRMISLAEKEMEELE